LHAGKTLKNAGIAAFPDDSFVGTTVVEDRKYGFNTVYDAYLTWM